MSPPRGAVVSCRHAAAVKRLFVLGGPAPLTRVHVAEAIRTALAATHTLADCVTVTPIPRSDAGLPYPAPLDATLCSGAVEAYIGRRMTDVLHDVLPALAAAVCASLTAASNPP